MAVIRYLAHAALMSTLIAGCSQSLFDARPGDEEGDRDGGAPSDARRADGGNVDGPDAGSTPDAGVQPGCPSPCAGDAARDFAFEPNGYWRYTETVLGPTGLPLFTDMVYATWNELSAWVGQVVPPAIASCGSNSGAQSCSGVEQKLLFVPTGDTLNAQPALLWVVSKAGGFRLTADWRAPDGVATGVPTSVRVGRNNLFDNLYTTTFNTSTSPGAFDIEVDGVLGDVIALAVIPGADPGVPLGMSFYVTDLQNNAACVMTSLFEGAAASFLNRCSDATFDEAGATQTQPAMPPPGLPGRARTFSDMTSLHYQGAPIDYSGDWTLQFWAAIEGPGEILSDHTCSMDGAGFTAGGVAIDFNGNTLSIRVGDEISNSDCSAGSGQRTIQLAEGADIVEAPNWHHYRVVRDKDAGTVTACVDGMYRSEHVLALSPDATMATARPLDLGHRTGATAGAFAGALADLRVYKRALPCTLRAP